MFTPVLQLVATQVIAIVRSPLPSLTIVRTHLLLFLLPRFQYPATLSPARDMSASPQKRLTSHSTRLSGVMAPASHVLGIKLCSFAKSRLPVPNKPKVRALHRRTFIAAPPIPFAPIVDTHAFQAPPPYSARPDVSTGFLLVPCNTPEASPHAIMSGDIKSPRDKQTDGSGFLHDGTTQSAGALDISGLSERVQIRGRLSSSGGQVLGLGLEGVENGDGGHFDGLGRLSGGFRASMGGTETDTSVSADSSQELREEMQKILIEHSKRRRTRAREQPKKRHDVFYASVDVHECQKAPPRTVKIVIRRQSVASPTPPTRTRNLPCQLTRDISRCTISSGLKRAASLERRASLIEGNVKGVGWRV
ncbi:hypothetical protein BS17DRAFT_780173 [Gyrodon lividus]|nr:hypothetical protein BS17DRAFT_780173 [Gyrodon lividus]